MRVWAAAQRAPGDGWPGDGWPGGVRPFEGNPPLTTKTIPCKTWRTEPSLGQLRSVSKKSTRCQENEYFIFLSCIIFFCRPSKGFALRRVRSANFQFAVASRANALPPFVTFGDGWSEAAFTRLEVRGRPKGPRRTGTPTRRSRGWGEKKNDIGSGHLGRSSVRQSRPCGLNMKGLRPLHASPKRRK